MSRWTIAWLKRLHPSTRLLWAARLFWITFFLSIICTLLISQGWFERVLMFISWWAITITCVDIIATSDVRDEEITREEEP